VAAESVEPVVVAEMLRHGDTVIDVREPSEYAEGHVGGAINIPIGALPGAELPDGPLITVCSTGRRAERAADMLDELGRTAFWIDGGTEAWQAKRLPVITGPEPVRRLRDRHGPVGAVAESVVSVAETAKAKAETVTEKVVDKLKPSR
jgi:rhodanese-related sulfurtransferase